MARIEWTEERNEVIRQGIEKRNGVADIAADLGVSFEATRRQIRRLGLKPSGTNRRAHSGITLDRDLRGQQAKRTCLSCRRAFPSEHKGNRICGACTSNHENSRHAIHGLDAVYTPGRALEGRRIGHYGGAM